MNDEESILTNCDTRTWFEQLEEVKKQQKDIDRKMLHLERESKMLGL